MKFVQDLLSRTAESTIDCRYGHVVLAETILAVAVHLSIPIQCHYCRSLLETKPMYIIKPENLSLNMM